MSGIIKRRFTIYFRKGENLGYSMLLRWTSHLDFVEDVRNELERLKDTETLWWSIS